MVTCSLFIENSGRLVCGLSDGNIVIIPVMHTVRMLLLSQPANKTSKYVAKENKQIEIFHNFSIKISVPIIAIDLIMILLLSLWFL